jgi:SRSO17 transposase
VFVQTTESEAAAAVRIGAALVARERGRLLEGLRPCFARTQVWVQAGKYVAAVMSDLPARNGWSIARHAGDRSPDKTQRLLNHARWDTLEAMSVVARFAVAGLDEAARRNRRAGGLRAGVLDETGQEKQGAATAGVKRQYMGCAGRIANGINTVHLSYVRERTGHVLAGARQWIPAADITDPVKSVLTGLPSGLRPRTKGQLAIDILTGGYADGLVLDFVCGDEVYGWCTELRAFLEQRGQAYVLRVASNFPLPLPGGISLTCAQAVSTLLTARDWQIRSAGAGSKGQRLYAWAQIATASPRHRLLVRRHLKTGELAFHYCYVPEGQAASTGRLIRAAGLRWPVEESFELAKSCFGLDQCQARLCTAIQRHLVLVMAALAVCAIAAARLRGRTGTEAAPPGSPHSRCPADPGLVPLSVPEIRRITAALTARPSPPSLVIHWDAWTRRHQARSRWYHKRARLQRDYALVS